MEIELELNPESFDFDLLKKEVEREMVHKDLAEVGRNLHNVKRITLQRGNLGDMIVFEAWKGTSAAYHFHTLDDILCFFDREQKKRILKEFL